jgi:hypothetical protein
MDLYVSAPVQVNEHAAASSILVSDGSSLRDKLPSRVPNHAPELLTKENAEERIFRLEKSAPMN